MGRILDHLKTTSAYFNKLFWRYKDVGSENLPMQISYTVHLYQADFVNVILNLLTTGVYTLSEASKLAS